MSDLSGFHPIVTLMHRIKASGNEFPKVRLAFGDKPLALSVAGSKSRTPGYVNLTDGAKYPNNIHYGAVSVTGDFIPSQKARALDADSKKALWVLLTEMRNGNAEKVFADFGRKFGVCAICGRELTNAESVEFGIGPVCRSKTF